MRDKIQYTSHPIRNMKIGRKFIFKDATLTLESEEDEKEFLSIIESKGFPSRERSRIKKLDFKLAEAISKEVQATKPRTTQVMDSSVGERATLAPKVGLGDLLTGGGNDPEVTEPAKTDEVEPAKEKPKLPTSGGIPGSNKPVSAKN